MKGMALATVLDISSMSMKDHMVSDPARVIYFFLTLLFKTNSHRSAHNKAALKAGMTVSNEPGYYEDGRYGIRIENIVLVREVKTPNNYGKKGYLGFEHVTL
jgi:Xaa-Pro aminopeptidase